MKKILYLILFTVLIFASAGCGETAPEASTQNSSESSETNTTEFSDTSSVDDPQVILNKCGPFRFMYKGVTPWKHGEDVAVDASMEYLGEEIYPYYSTCLAQPNIAVYYNADGSAELTEESFCVSLMTTSSPAYQNGIQPGEKCLGNGFAHLPEDAPLGKYHVKVSFEDYYQIFENAIEVVE